MNKYFVGKVKVQILLKRRLLFNIYPGLLRSYERIYELMEFFEHIQIYQAVGQRKETPLSEYIDLDQLLAEQGIDLNVC
jgi:DNA polymerase sigma